MTILCGGVLVAEVFLGVNRWVPRECWKARKSAGGKRVAQWDRFSFFTRKRCKFRKKDKDPLREPLYIRPPKSVGFLRPFTRPREWTSSLLGTMIGKGLIFLLRNPRRANLANSAIALDAQTIFWCCVERNFSRYFIQVNCDSFFRVDIIYNNMSHTILIIHHYNLHWNKILIEFFWMFSLKTLHSLTQALMFSTIISKISPSQFLTTDAISS